MRQNYIKLYLADDTTIKFNDFTLAINFCENEFGFDGVDWDEIVESNDLGVLHDYLDDNDIEVDWI